MRWVLWYLQESNQGHTDFQSVALPTELRYQNVIFFESPPFCALKLCGPARLSKTARFCEGGCKYNFNL